LRIPHLILLPICLIGLSFLQSCVMDTCEEHEPVSTYYSISAADKSKIPFTGTDTLVYISTDGDTAILYGQGKKVYNEKVAVDRDPDPGCTKNDYNYFENIEFTYRGDHPNLRYIFIDFNASSYGPEQTRADIVVGASSCSAYFGRLHNSNNYIDSVTINSITYSGRKIFDDANLSFIYNLQYGFLQISTSNRVWLKHF
jgi:hypothetical protein